MTEHSERDRPRHFHAEHSSVTIHVPSNYDKSGSRTLILIILIILIHLHAREMSYGIQTPEPLCGAVLLLEKPELLPVQFETCRTSSLT